MKFRTIVQLVIAGMLGILSRDVAVAQSVPRGVGTIEIQVRVTYQGTNTPAKQVKVELLSLSEIPLQQKFTDAQGRVSFVVDVDRPPLEFRVRASGQGIEESVSDHVRFERRVEAGSSRIVDLEVKSTGEPQPQTTTAVTSVAEAQIPKKARNAFHDGLTAWQKKDWQQAAANFQKATELYPQYDDAFNYLGMVYAHLSQPEKSRAAFETAVKLNDKNASADRNLAGILLNEHDYRRAAELAQKSVAVDPSNAFALTVLAIAELQMGDLDSAFRYAHQAHATPHEGYALCHYIAGTALERNRDPKGAKFEYELYLRETPDGPEAAKVKQALVRLAAADNSQ